MKFIVALFAVTQAISLKKGDLPYTEVIDKVDTLSRYVNDDDLVMDGSDVVLVMINKGDLPYTEVIDNMMGYMD